jgi:hypothetical protein
MNGSGWPCLAGPQRVIYRIMTKKKKKDRLQVGKEARRRARLGIGLPPPERTIPDKKDKPAKHKKTLVDLLRNG